MNEARFDRCPRALVSEARKFTEEAVNGWFLFGGRKEHWILAAETYERAGNEFRFRQKYIEAGKAFEQCANIQRLKLSNPNDAANTLVEAFKCYRKHRPEDAVHCLGLAIQQFARSGLIRRAATCQQMMAECYEAELYKPQEAIESYEVAADWFESDNAFELAFQSHRKIGELAGYLENWPKAISSFELVASRKTWLAKEYLFKAGLAHLARMDMVSFDRWLDRYASMEVKFSNSKEHLLLFDLGSAVKKQDTQRFWTICKTYHDVNQPETWRTFVLFKIKEKMEALEDDFS
ncbi:soluble NSF attachment protein [Cadophora sp. MPI-SDFR-AT-0126]|nr:soluble NSF attachment protein [Leotiomycetes sp. MPI-SDFR-AT-0126]